MDIQELDNKNYYSIKQASKYLGVETYLLRYWEDELGLKILRTETGRRIYQKDDLLKFKEIIDYRNAGGKLKNLKEELKSQEKKDQPDDIKDTQRIIDMKRLDRFERNKYISKNMKDIPVIGQTTKSEIEILNREENNEEKVQKLQELLNKAFTKALEESTQSMLMQVSDDVKDTVSKEIDYQFRMREEREEEREEIRKKREEEWMKNQEEHFRMFDELLRSGSSSIRKRNKIIKNKK